MAGKLMSIKPEELREKILTKASKNKKFRADLEKNPRKAIENAFKQYDLGEVPCELNIHVHINSANHVHFVIDLDDIRPRLGRKLGW